VLTVDAARVCRTCSCPRLRTYRTTDAYCAACGHPAALHAEPLDELHIEPPRAEEPTALPLHHEEPIESSIHEVEVTPSWLPEPEPAARPIHEEETIPGSRRKPEVASSPPPVIQLTSTWLTGPDVVHSSPSKKERAPSLIQDEELEDEELESGWRAVLPSGVFFSVAIAAAGVGLIAEGLAERFKELLTAAPWW
jgi:hypothetical protein